MPVYTFFNEKTNEYKDIVMSMSEEHLYIDEMGYKWTRVFHIPQSSIDSKVDEFDSRDFVEKTGKKRGTLGNIMDLSKELSMKRAEKIGNDPIKEKYYDSYKKKTNGKPHIDTIRENARKNLDKMGISVT